MRRRPLAVLPLLAVLLLGTLAFAGSAQAASGRQCRPNPGEQSLVVRGATTCRKVERILPLMREYALQTAEVGAEEFTISGYACELRNGDPRRFTCRDANGRPQRSFTWVDRS